MRLYVNFRLVVCIVTVTLHSALPQLSEGSKCHDGTCIRIPQCLPAMEDIRNYGHHNFTRCGFHNLIEIVCCPNAGVLNLRFVNSEPSRKSIRACDNYNKNLSIFLNYHISGGTDAASGEFPHMAALGLYSTKDGLYRFDCGATLIASKHLVTAAHCIFNREGDEVKIVRMGVVKVPQTTNEANNLHDYRVKNVTVHPKYNRRKNTDDIGLVELEKEVIFEDYIRPACLYTSEAIPKEFMITGWGVINNNGRRSDNLQKGIVSSVSFKECSQRYKKSYNWTITDNQLCASGNTTDTCLGDSGGPLQLRNSKVPVLVGITSIGESFCGKGFPTIYTRIYKYLDWIEKIVWP